MGGPAEQPPDAEQRAASADREGIAAQRRAWRAGEDDFSHYNLDDPGVANGKARGGRIRRADGGPSTNDITDVTRDAETEHKTPNWRESSRSRDDDFAKGGGVAFRTPSGSVSAGARREAHSKGQTMADGSFPIRNASDLSNAKHDVGRAKNPEAARRWINKRARDLGEPPLGG